jgi:hypothetical protein
MRRQATYHKTKDLSDREGHKTNGDNQQDEKRGKITVVRTNTTIIMLAVRACNDGSCEDKAKRATRAAATREEVTQVIMLQTVSAIQIGALKIGDMEGYKYWPKAQRGGF